LYEQCSLHITLKIPNSVRLGTRPIFFSMLAYSSAVMLCVFSSSGVIPAGVGTAFANAAVMEEGTVGAETSGAATSTTGSIG
jgi:hypothetical protein